LYHDKNYAIEAQFVLEKLCMVSPRVLRHILDLGCGTGLHAVHMARTGISVTGIDRSADMVAVAENRRKSLSENVRNCLDFRIGDIRTIHLHRRYEAVLALFHVMSYQIRDSDLKAVFQMVRRHLQAGGAFMFDFWYGPAVLRHPPQPRAKTSRLGDNIITRKMTPEWDRKRHVVRVKYDIEIKNIVSGEKTRDREQHVVRYYFLDEVRDRLAVCGFEVVQIGEWMTGKCPTDDNFSVYALAKA
jgi:SAM-dependent methyltransferase